MADKIDYDYHMVHEIDYDYHMLPRGTKKKLMFLDVFFHSKFRTELRVPQGT